jgi:hypothetical protein
LHPLEKAPPCHGARGNRLFDDLVGAGEDRWRHGQPERFGGLEIDDQLEVGRLVDGQIGGLGAVEDLSEVNASLMIGSGEAGPVADQAPAATNSRAK